VLAGAASIFRSVLFFVSFFLLVFDWDDANIGHIAAHDVSPEEAEEALLADPMDFGFDVENGEECWSFAGETEEWRILRVSMTMRGTKVRVVTAFEPSRLQKTICVTWKAGLS
jgi:uncharacterized DUF497 family protein